MMRGMRTALLLLLLPSIAGASGTRLARCDSGKAGTLQLFVTRDAQGNYALSSRDSAEGAEARVFTGQVTRITHRKLDARHHVYRLELEGGALQQAAGLDAAHCQDEGARARCAGSCG